MELCEDQICDGEKSPGSCMAKGGRERGAWVLASGGQGRGGRQIREIFKLQPLQPVIPKSGCVLGPLSEIF